MKATRILDNGQTFTFVKSKIKVDSLTIIFSIMDLIYFDEKITKASILKKIKLNLHSSGSYYYLAYDPQQFEDIKDVIEKAIGLCEKIYPDFTINDSDLSRLNKLGEE